MTSPTTIGSAADWIAWVFSPEHFVIAVIGGAIGVGLVIGLALVIDRLWRRASDQIDQAAVPATASKHDWWLCPVCGSLNRPSQHCYKGCATTDGQVLPSRGDERPGDPTSEIGT
jgi:hypothetical protein